jgi:hypothetical protein
MQYSCIEDESSDTGNFDLLIDYKINDFKDFHDICKQLCDFRQQSRGINQKFNELNKSIGLCDKDLETFKGLREIYDSNEEWLKKVDELTELYKQISDYEEKKKELATIEEQKAITDTITGEFKIQTSQAGVCVLCYENPIEVFLDPCGHVCCGVCWSKSDRGSRTPCPCCRTPVTKKKMYLI